MHKCFFWGILLACQTTIFAQNDSGFQCLALAEVHELLAEEDIYAAKETLASIKPESEHCRAEYLYLKGSIALYRSDYHDAQIHLKDAYQSFRALKQNQNTVLAALQLALAYVEDGQETAAIPLLDEVLSSPPLLKFTNIQYQLLDVRAMLHTMHGEHAEALDLLKKAASYAKGEQDLVNQSQLLNQIATNYQSQAEIDSAIHYYNKLILVKKTLNDQAGLLSDYSTLGGLYRKLGNYKPAQSAFIEALGYAATLDDTRSQVPIYIDMANIYLEEYMLEPALEYADTALSLAQASDMLLSEGESHMLKGAIKEQQRESDAALSAYETALGIYEELGLKQYSAELLIKIARISLDAAPLVKAELLLRDVLAVQAASGDRIGELNSKLLLSEVLLALNKNYREISSLLDAAAMIAKESSSASGLQEVYRLNSQLDEKRGNFKKALLLYQKYTAIKDSIISQENAKTVRSLEKQFETAQKDKAITEQRAALNQQEQTLQVRKVQIYLLVTGILFFVALSILIAFINRRNKQINKQKLKMLRKEREAEVLRAMFSGEEQERIRIARDLHDSLGAMMATAKMRVSALTNVFPKLKELDSYKRTEALLDDAYHSVREVTHNMIPGALRKFGLEMAIANRCEAIEETHGIQVDFIPFGLDELDNDILETNVFRVVQELLQNVVKHAEATEVIVQLTYEDELFDIVVEDNGKGFEVDAPSSQRGIGLESIRSRVVFLKGKMTIESTINQGSTFSINIPT